MVAIAVAILISIVLRMAVLPAVLPDTVLDEGQALSYTPATADQLRGNTVAVSYGFEPHDGSVSCWEIDPHSIDSEAPTGSILRWCAESNGNSFYPVSEDAFAIGCVPDSDEDTGVPVNKLICGGYYRMDMGPLHWIVGPGHRAFEVSLYNDGTYRYEAWSLGR